MKPAQALVKPEASADNFALQDDYSEDEKVTPKPEEVRQLAEKVTTLEKQLSDEINSHKNLQVDVRDIVGKLSKERAELAVKEIENGQLMSEIKELKKKVSSKLGVAAPSRNR